MSARKGLDGAILGRRGTELVNTHVAELVKHAHPEFQPTYHASKDLITWPNGATTFLFSAERPENIRSVNLSYAWVDEAAFMDEIETAWMNLRLATRISTPGNPIHFLITSTPTSTPWVMKMEDDPTVEVRRVSTYANRANLDAEFIEALRREYEGTRMGRQELYGEVLRDVEGALWNDSMFVHERAEGEDFYDRLEALDERVLAVDPAGSKGKRSDATGIIGVGVSRDDDGDRFTVFGDATLKGSPKEWAAQTFKAARLWDVSRIIVERNFGGDMVTQTLRDYAALHPEEAMDSSGMEFRIVETRAVKGKETRAEPVVARYEQRRVLHLSSDQPFGDLSELEKEQINWVPKSRGGKSPSPNRIDACLAEGTMILLGDGVTEKPIEEIEPGDLVMTRKGPRRAVRAWVSRTNAEVIGRVSGNRTLWATPDHKVWTDTPEEWINFGSDANEWGNILVWNTQTRQANLDRWSGTASGGRGTAANEPTPCTTQHPRSLGGPMVGGSANCTERSTSTRPETSPTGCMSTTSTRTRSTTTRATSLLSLLRSTLAFTRGHSIDGSIGSSTSSLPPHGRSERILTLLQGLRGQVARAGNGNRSSISPARSAVVRTGPRRGHEPGSTTTAPQSASGSSLVGPSERGTAIGDSGSRSSAPFAATPSRSTTETTARSLGSPADLVRASTRIEPRVWDMEVEDEHEFFANGVLVHNCVWAFFDLSRAKTFAIASATQSDVMTKMRRTGRHLFL